jgi:hypothetical protein
MKILTVKEMLAFYRSVTMSLKVVVKFFVLVAFVIYPNDEYISQVI